MSKELEIEIEQELLNIVKHLNVQHTVEYFRDYMKHFEKKFQNNRTIYTKNKKYIKLKELVALWKELKNSESKTRIYVKQLKPFYLDGKKYYYQYETYLPAITYNQIYLSMIRNYKRERKDKIDLLFELPEKNEAIELDDKHAYVKVPTKYAKIYFVKSDIKLVRDILKQIKNSSRLYKDLLEKFKELK